MIILANAKKVLTIPTPFHDKTHIKLEGKIPQLEKEIYKNPQLLEW